MASVYGAAVIEPTTQVMLALLFVAAFSTYAFRNQWVVARVAPLLHTGAVGPKDEQWVVVLPDNNAVTLSVVARARTVAYKNLLVTHCALARSVALFEVANPVQWYALIPQYAGFEISNGKGRWDGVDGRSLDGSNSLKRQMVGLCPFVQWRRANPQASLLSVDLSQPPEGRRQSTQLPGARGMDNPMEWGCVEGDESWRAFNDNDGAGSRFDYVLSRWAAINRGLVG
jgi:hypothetical protein